MNFESFKSKVVNVTLKRKKMCEKNILRNS